jgi:hypothetical protein
MSLSGKDGMTQTIEPVTNQDAHMGILATDTQTMANPMIKNIGVVLHMSTYKSYKMKH